MPKLRIDKQQVIDVLKKRWWVMLIEFLLVGVILVADLVSKQYVCDFLRTQPGLSHDFIRGFIDLQYTENTGAGFGVLAGNTVALTVVTIIVVVGLFAYLFLAQKQGEWLRKEVASEEYKKAPWKVVFMHIPPKPDDADEDRAEPHFEDQVPTLVKAEPDIVLCGHDHRYQYYNKEDAKKMGFSFPFVIGDSKPLNRATVTRLDVAEGELGVKVFRGDGVTLTNEVWHK